MGKRRYTPHLHRFRKMKIARHAILLAQKQLHELEGVARFPFENPNPIFRTTPQGKILYANPACALLFSYWQCQVGDLLPAPVLAVVLDLWANQTRKTMDIDYQGKFFSIQIVPDYFQDYINFYGRDITDRVEIERNLKKREEQLHLALQAANQGLYDYDFRTNKVEISPESKSLFDFNFDLITSIEDIQSRLHPDDNAPLTEAFQRYARAEVSSFFVDFRFNKGNGDWIWLLLQGKVIERDVQGNPLHMIGTFTDITEFKHAEYALRESEERYRSLFESGIDANILSTREGDILAVNPDACRIFGYTQAEFLKLKRTDIVEDTHGFLKNLLETLYRDGKYRGELPLIRKNGERFIGEASIAIFQAHNGQLRNSVIIRDVTERKQTEAALRLDEARLEALYTLNQLKLADEEVLLRFALDKAVELTGSELGYLFFTQDDVIDLGKFYWSSSLQGVCHAPEVEHYPVDQAGAWAESFRQRHPVIQNDFMSYPERRGYPEGHPTIFRHLGVPVMAGDRVVLVAGVGNKALPYNEADVRQLQLFAEGIWSMVYRMRDETRLKKTLADKEVLLREVHHRVKNNLQAMIALMDMQKAQINDQQTQRFLLELQQQARTMSLVYELLYQTDNLSQVEMADFLQQVAANLLDAYGGYQTIDLKVDCDPLRLSVETAMPCGLIVNELLTNALKYAFPKGFTEQKQISVSLKIKEEAVVLEVNDNGIGLSLDTEHKRKQAMGLNLVNLWVTHQLGGQIEIYTRPGTRFVITFHNL